MMRPALTPGVWNVVDNSDDVGEFSIATNVDGIKPAAQIMESAQSPKPMRVRGIMQLPHTVHKAPWSLATYYAQRAAEADRDAEWKNKVVQEIVSRAGEASNRARKAAFTARHSYLQSIAPGATDMVSSLRQLCSMGSDKQLRSASPEVQDLCAAFHKTDGSQHPSPFLGPRVAPPKRWKLHKVDGSGADARDIMSGRRALPSLKTMVQLKGSTRRAQEFFSHGVHGANFSDPSTHILESHVPLVALENPSHHVEADLLHVQDAHSSNPDFHALVH